MEKFLTRSSSSGSLSNKRAADGEPEKWQSPKRTAIAKSPVNRDQTTLMSNRFSKLPLDQPPDDCQHQPPTDVSSKPKSPRIPPILISIESNWTHNSIKDLISKYNKNFHLKYKANNKVAVHSYSSISHQLIKDGLSAEKVSFHTFTRKDEKTLKAVIRGLPSNVEEDLPEELTGLGFPECKVTKLKSSAETSNALFLVQLPPGSDILKFKKIRYICSCVVEIEKFKPKQHYGTQCFRCQDFGHTSRNCNLPPRCVKCTGTHLTKDCPNGEASKKVQCCNCKEFHAASYRQCPARQAYLKRIQLQREDSRSKPVKMLPSSRSNFYAAVDGRSWVQVTKSVKQPESESLKTSQHDVKFPRNNPDPSDVHDPTVLEMLQILNTLKSIKAQYLSCTSMLDKVTLILTHLGHYV